MRKSRAWIVGSVAVAVVAILTTSGVLAWRSPDVSDRQPGHYVVAAAEEARLVQRPVASTVRVGGPLPLPGSLSLVVVGSLLMGLAAAVRRTT